MIKVTGFFFFFFCGLVFWMFGFFFASLAKLLNIHVPSSRRKAVGKHCRGFAVLPGAHPSCSAEWEEDDDFLVVFLGWEGWLLPSQLPHSLLTCLRRGGGGLTLGKTEGCQPPCR